MLPSRGLCLFMLRDMRRAPQVVDLESVSYESSSLFLGDRTLRTYITIHVVERAAFHCLIATVSCSTQDRDHMESLLMQFDSPQHWARLSMPRNDVPEA